VVIPATSYITANVRQEIDAPPVPCAPCRRRIVPDRQTFSVTVRSRCSRTRSRTVVTGIERAAVKRSVDLKAHRDSRRRSATARIDGSFGEVENLGLLGYRPSSTPTTCSGRYSSPGGRSAQVPCLD